MSKIIKRRVTVAIEGHSVALTLHREVTRGTRVLVSVLYHGENMGEMLSYNEAVGAETILNNGTYRMREYHAKSMAAGFEWICKNAIAPLLRAQKFAVGAKVKMTSVGGDRINVTIKSPLLCDDRGTRGYYVDGYGPKTFAYAKGLRAA